MKKITIYYLLFTILLFVFVPLTPAQAAIVQCGRNPGPDVPEEQTKPCEVCDLLQLLRRIIDFITFTLTPILGGLLFLTAGFLIILGGANTEMVSMGRSMFFKTVIGVVIIYASWLVANTVIQIIAGDNKEATSWFKLECKPPKFAPIPTPTVEALCNDPSALAAKYNERYPRGNAPELNDLIACIGREINPNLLGEISTFDKTYELCNYTRGLSVCTEKCSHTVNSCHYGGARGSEGAMAVDFGNEDQGDGIMRAALACGAKSARCETNSGTPVSCQSGSATHVHVNSKSCDKN